MYQWRTSNMHKHVCRHLDHSCRNTKWIQVKDIHFLKSCLVSRYQYYYGGGR